MTKKNPQQRTQYHRRPYYRRPPMWYDYDWYDYDWYDHDWYDYDWYDHDWHDRDRYNPRYYNQQEPKVKVSKEDIKNRPKMENTTNVLVEPALLTALMQFSRDQSLTDDQIYTVIEKMIWLNQSGEVLDMSDLNYLINGITETTKTTKAVEKPTDIVEKQEK